jgi:hypothetical protein
VNDKRFQVPGYTGFNVTYDSQYQALGFLIGTEAVEDVEEVHIRRSPQSGYECSIVRKGHPARLVASGSPRGKAARQAGRAKATATPGFVEVAPENKATSSVAQAISEYFGGEQPDQAEPEAPAQDDPQLDLKKARADIEHYFTEDSK